MKTSKKSNKKKDVPAPEKIKEQNEDIKDKKKSGKEKPLKYGPMPTFPKQRIFTRGVIILSTLVIVYFTSNKKDITFATQKEIVSQRGQTFECSNSYSKELINFPGCVPEKCGRALSDKLVTAHEADILLKIARSGLALGGSDGGASILDLHSGALSNGTQFINVYSLSAAKKIFNAPEFVVYKIVKTKIQHAIAHNFGVDVSKIHLTHPTFFSKMTVAEAKTIHDEYWHVHVDKETYESFHYTSLVYLSDYSIDFTGGRFIFTLPSNSTVEPRKGRVLMFTSGAENPHYVEKLESGIRYALTVSFTCDENFAIADPSIKSID